MEVTMISNVEVVLERVILREVDSVDYGQTFL
jgi:hypothetical protein